ncbi:MAG: hypothetical protein IJ491_03640 [Clostridia bacterium]|nr:hypothetical protein [Clostridia bacterium]
MFNSFNIDLRIEEKIQKFALRFSVASQLKFKKKYKLEGVQAVLNCFDDLEMMLDFFTEALSFKDNNNPVTDGAEFYDILVNNGYCGQEDFTKLVLQIASSSGIVKQNQGEKVAEAISNTYNAMFDSFSIDEEAEKELESTTDEGSEYKDAKKVKSFRTEENADS